MKLGNSLEVHYKSTTAHFERELVLLKNALHITRADVFLRKTGLDELP